MPEIGILGFIGVLESALHHSEKHMHGPLERAAKVVEAEAKAEIGQYQGAAGQFAEWPELADRTKAERSALGYSEDEPLLRDGTLRDSIGHEVHGNEAVIGSPLDVALYQEVGTPNARFPIPPRSFLGGALVRKAHEVVHICGEGAAKTLFGGSDRTQIP